ncbi:MAG: hypothetical protein V1872_09660 [bacterium]
MHTKRIKIRRYRKKKNNNVLIIIIISILLGITILTYSLITTSSPLNNNSLKVKNKKIRVTSESNKENIKQ